MDVPNEYSWSIYAINALNVENEFQTPHPEHLTLWKSKNEQLKNCRKLFKTHVGTELLKEIRLRINKELTIGNERLTSQIEKLTH